MGPNKRVPSQSTFQESWLNTPRLQEWVQKVPNDQRAKHILFSKVIDITSMGQQALVSHIQGRIQRGGPAPPPRNIRLPQISIPVQHIVLQS